MTEAVPECCCIRVSLSSFVRVATTAQQPVGLKKCCSLVLEEAIGHV